MVNHIWPAAMRRHQAPSMLRGMRGLGMLLLACRSGVQSTLIEDVQSTKIEDVVDLPDVFLGGHRSNIFNSKGKYVVLLLHGYMNNVTDYYPLGRRLAERGYAVVIPHDCSGPTAIACAATWG